MRGTDELQLLVDALAAEIGRPIGIDDRRFRVLAYSSHVDEVDSVRLASILQREGPEDVARWLESLGVADADPYVRVEANPSFAMAARICVPVRFQGVLLGYLWLIDWPVAVDDDEISASVRCAADAGVILYRQRLLHQEDRTRQQALLQELVSGRPGEREQAAAGLVCGGFLSRAALYSVLVLEPVHATAPHAPDSIHARLVAGVENVRRTTAPRHLLMLVTGEQLTLVLACDDEDGGRRRACAVLDAVEDNLRQVPDWSVVIGVGTAHRSPLAVHESHAEAERAARLGRAVPGVGPIVVWSELGAYRTIATLVGGSDVTTLVPESVSRLLDSDGGLTLALTLEAYLERAGDARATAEAIFLHRSTLYHRLHRIEQITGADLRRGDARLELQLGLRLWRMAGSEPSPQVGRFDPLAPPAHELAQRTALRRVR